MIRHILRTLVLFFADGFRSLLYLSSNPRRLVHAEPIQSKRLALRCEREVLKEIRFR